MALEHRQRVVGNVLIAVVEAEADDRRDVSRVLVECARDARRPPRRAALRRASSSICAANFSGVTPNSSVSGETRW